jgi:hypothetical protein
MIREARPADIPEMQRVRNAVNENRLGIEARGLGRQHDARPLLFRNAAKHPAQHCSG